MIGELELSELRETHDKKKYPNFYMYVYVCCERALSKGYTQINVMDKGVRVYRYGYGKESLVIAPPNGISR